MATEFVLHSKKKKWSDFTTLNFCTQINTYGQTSSLNMTSSFQEVEELET